MTFLIFLFLCLISPSSISAESSVQITQYSSKGSNEWIEIFNNSSDSINLSGWSFKDADTNPKSLSGCISPNSNKIFDYYQFLNDKEGETLSLYNQKGELVQNYGNLEIIQKDKPTVTSTCELCSYTYSDWIACSSSGTQTRTYTSSPDSCFGTPEITSQSCTYNPPIPTPSKGTTSLTEFMPYTSYEWAEVYNSDDKTVDLSGWSIYDNEAKIIDIGGTIPAKSFLKISLSGASRKLDDTGDSIILKNKTGDIITQYTYPSGKYINAEVSWSYIFGSWCQADYTPGSSNAQNCYSSPTSPTPTPTPDSTKYIADEDATASAIIEPKTEESFLSPTSTEEPTPTTTGLILGDTDSSSSTAKKNYFPLILIVSGGLLLTSPALINKLKPKK